MDIKLRDIGQQATYHEWAQQKLRLVHVDYKGGGMSNEEILLRTLVELVGALADEVVELKKQR